jgi:hypothetical protein
VVADVSANHVTFTYKAVLSVWHFEDEVITILRSAGRRSPQNVVTLLGRSDFPTLQFSGIVGRLWVDLHYQPLQLTNLALVVFSLLSSCFFSEPSFSGKNVHVLLFPSSPHF